MRKKYFSRYRRKFRRVFTKKKKFARKMRKLAKSQLATGRMF